MARRVSPRPAALVRIGVGAAALLKGGMAWGRARDVLAPGSLRAPWPEGFPAVPDGVVLGAVACWIVAAVAFTVGARVRVAGGVLVASIAVYLLADRHFYQNHVYLLALLVFLLTLARSAEWLALDGGGARTTIPAWPLDLVRLQVTLVYLFGALSKINPDFLSGSTLASSWRDSRVGGALVAALDWRGFLALAGVTVALEVWIALALWNPRQRPAAIGLGVLLHGGILLLMTDRGDLTVFALLMFSGYLLFLEAEERSRLLIWDDHCTFCAGWVRRIRALDWMRVHRLAGSSEPGVLEEAGVTREEADAALQHIGPRGRAQGYDGVRAALELLPATFLVAPFMGLPGVRHVGRRVYRRVAERRHCALPERGG